MPLVHLLRLSFPSKRLPSAPNTRRTYHSLCQHPHDRRSPKPRMPSCEMCSTMNMLVDPHTSHTDRHGGYSRTQHDSLVDTESFCSDTGIGGRGLEGEDAEEEEEECRGHQGRVPYEPSGGEAVTEGYIPCQREEEGGTGLDYLAR
jgi:hypothetical protein